MSATTCPDYPDELKLAIWEKKGSLPSGHEIGDKLKAFQQMHDAVDWKPESASLAPAPAPH